MPLVAVRQWRQGDDIGGGKAMTLVVDSGAVTTGQDGGGRQGQWGHGGGARPMGSRVGNGATLVGHGVATPPGRGGEGRSGRGGVRGERGGVARAFTGVHTPLRHLTINKIGVYL